MVCVERDILRTIEWFGLGLEMTFVGRVGRDLHRIIECFWLEGTFIGS